MGKKLKIHEIDIVVQTDRGISIRRIDSLEDIARLLLNETPIGDYVIDQISEELKETTKAFSEN